MLKLNRKIATEYLRENSFVQRKVVPRLAVINEQNEPLKMTVEEYINDTKNAGIDQCDRLLWWRKKGYGILEFDYLQPSLNDNQKECKYLNLNIWTPDKRSIVSSEIVFEHLKRFVHISVLKGKNPKDNAILKKMMKDLESKNYLNILRPDYGKLKTALYRHNVSPRQYDKTLGELLKERKSKKRLTYKIGYFDVIS